MNPATLRRLRPRGHTRRAQVLDAATKVFIENGYGAATIDLVVSRAGASKATIYSFFGGKEGLFTAAAEALRVKEPLEWDDDNLGDLARANSVACTAGVNCPVIAGSALRPWAR